MSQRVGDWRARFATPIKKAVVRAAGFDDAELVVEVGPSGVTTAVWTPADDRLSVVPGLAGNVLHPMLTADGRGVLVHVDVNGSEVGHVCLYGVDGSAPVDLTPEAEPYGLRGLATDRVGHSTVVTTSDDAGYTLLHVSRDADRYLSRELYHSDSEAWFGLVSADGAVASIDTTDHNPGIRRAALTVIDVARAEPIAVLCDGETGPVRGVRFCPSAGDQRILASTERAGEARPLG